MSYLKDYTRRILNTRLLPTPTAKVDPNPLQSDYTSNENRLNKEMLGWTSWRDTCVNTIIINRNSEIVDLVNQIEKVGICSLDFETTGLDPLQSNIRTIQLAIPKNWDKQSRFLSTDGKSPNKTSIDSYVCDLFELSRADHSYLLKSVINLIENPKIKVIGHGLKFDLAMLRSRVNKRFKVENIFDTMIASQLVTAGNYIPEECLDKWCTRNKIRKIKLDNKTTFIDENGQEFRFEKDFQKKVRPYYFRHGLNDLTIRHLGIYLQKQNQKEDWSGNITREMIEYAALDAAILFPLYDIMSTLIIQNKLEETAIIEFLCIPSTVEIELTGMPFDGEAAQKLLSELEEPMLKYKQELVSRSDSVGFKAKKTKQRNTHELNPNSSTHIINCFKLFANQDNILSSDQQSFIFINASNNSCEAFKISSSNDTLIAIEARLPDTSPLKGFIFCLKKYRELKNQVNQLQTFISYIHPETLRLHTSLRQLNPLGVGRFSAYEPNLQQVSNQSHIRQLFKCNDDRSLIICDYSAMEMRIMAQLSQDKNLMTAFQNKIDVHKHTAGNIIGKPIEEVTKDERQAAKAFGFGFIYGMYPDTFKKYAESGYGVTVTIEEAEQSRTKFFDFYYGIKDWHEKQSLNRFSNYHEHYFQHSWKTGFFSEALPTARTKSGRLRVWPIQEKKSQKGNYYSDKFGPVTELYNTPNQGTGADILKYAMALFYRRLISNGWSDVYLIATLHDELVIEAPNVIANKAKNLLNDVMIHAAKRYLTDIPVEADPHIGKSWAEK